MLLLKDTLIKHLIVVLEGRTIYIIIWHNTLLKVINYLRVRTTGVAAAHIIGELSEYIILAYKKRDCHRKGCTIFVLAQILKYWVKCSCTETLLLPGIRLIHSLHFSTGRKVKEQEKQENDTRQSICGSPNKTQILCITFWMSFMVFLYDGMQVTFCED